MKISLNWLSEFVDLSAYTPEEIAQRLTMTIAEVEEIVDQRNQFPGVVVGEILEFRKHAHADKLHVASVNIGKRKPLQVIFGQMVSMNVGDRVPVAIAPAELPSGVRIERKELRGEMSEGMLCVDQELGLANNGVSMQYFPNAKPGTPFAQAMGWDDVVFEIDNKSLTHRADLFSHVGIARELAAVFGIRMDERIMQTTLKSRKLKTVGIKITDPQAASRFIGTVLDVQIGPSPDVIRKRLESCGVRSMNNVVDITNYVMMELGEPLHAYDHAKLSERAAGKPIQVSVRFAANREQITTLDGKKRTCSDQVQLIADQVGGIGIAGIMGGLETEISDSTTRIFLEAAQFDPVVTRRAAQYLGLRTEGVMRWEKGLSPELAAVATQRAIELFQQHAHATVVEGPEDVYVRRPKRASIVLRPSYVSQLLGYEVKETQVVGSLERLGMTVENLTNGKRVTPPWWRQDVRIMEDLVEEVGRIVGLDQIPETPIVGPFTGVERDAVLTWTDALLEECVAVGMTEVKHYAFYGDRDVERAGLSAVKHSRLLNSLSSELDVLRTTLLIGLIRSMVRNQRDYERVWLCEVGHTFLSRQEPRLLSGVLAGNDSAVFYDAKGIVERLANRMHVALSTSPLKQAPATVAADVAMFDPDASATILFRGEPVGVIGMVTSTVITAMKSERMIAAFTLDLSAASATASRYAAYQMLPKYPSVKLDLSIEVPAAVSYDDVRSTILGTAGERLVALDLFDIYEGGKLQIGMKSFAFHLEYRDAQRTMTREEAQEIHDAISRALFKRHAVTVR